MDPKALGQFLMQPSTTDVLNTPVRRGGILPVTEYPNRSKFDLTSGLTGALWNALTAPARAARGEISEDQQIPEAFNFAGSLTLGSLLAPRPTGSVGMGGRAAKEALDMSEAAPLRAYHGTNRTIDRFTPSSDGNVGPGVYLTGSPDEASGYAFRSTDSNVFSPSVLPVEIRGKLASVDDYNAAYDAARDSVGSASEARKLAVETLRKAGFDGIDAPVGNTPNYSMFNPGTVYSATTGDILFANAKTGAAVPLATKALEAQQPQGIRAFHGSPHEFDRFDMSKVGTGEGAQAYGHGLYFAEAEDVARSYRDTLTKSGQDWGQRALDKVGGDVDAAIATIQSKIDKYRAGGADGYASAQEEVLRALNQYKETGSFSPGHMYEVNIRANPEDFLDWYAPTTGATMERVAQLGVKEGAKGFDALQQIAAQLARDGKLQTGKDLSVQVSEALRDAGIPGIRYLDQMSRGEGKGSSNYVVFDDNLIEILRKYGLLGPVAGGGTLAGMLMGGQDGETY